MEHQKEIMIQDDYPTMVLMLQAVLKANLIDIKTANKTLATLSQLCQKEPLYLW